MEIIILHKFGFGKILLKIISLKYYYHLKKNFKMLMFPILHFLKTF